MFLGLHGRVDLSEEDVAFSQIPGQGLVVTNDPFACCVGTLTRTQPARSVVHQAL